MLQYCADVTCSNDVWKANCTGRYCEGCGEEMTPCIRCLCGKTEYNPRTPQWMPKFCSVCGQQFTDAYLGQCMAAQLKGMVREITTKQSVETQGFLD